MLPGLKHHDLLADRRVGKMQARSVAAGQQLYAAGLLTEDKSCDAIHKLIGVIEDLDPAPY